MKLAFSTLGCPGAPLAEVVSLATRLGYDGIELRAAADEPVDAELSKAQRRGARQLIGDAGLETVCVASYVRLTQALDEPSYDPVADAESAIELAADLGAPLLRVFGGGERPDDDRIEVAGRALRDITTRAQGSGITVAIETHDAFCLGRDVARVLSVNGDGAGALWDVAHPFRKGESPTETASFIGPQVSHVHVKDLRVPDDLTPVPLGTGVVPLDAILEELAGLRYGGWISVEWEKKWHPEIRGAEEELAHAIAVLRERCEPLDL